LREPTVIGDPIDVESRYAAVLKDHLLSVGEAAGACRTRHRDRVLLRLSAVVEQPGEIDEGVAQRAQFPVQDGRDARLVHQQVREPEVAVHDDRWRRRRGIRAEESVHFVPHHVVLGAQTDAVPGSRQPADLALQIRHLWRSAEVGETNRLRIEGMQMGEGTDDLQAEFVPLLPSQCGGIVLAFHGRAGHPLHHEEPCARGSGPGTDDPRNRNAGVGEFRHDVSLARHVMGRLRMVTWWRLAQHPLPTARGGDDRGDVGLPEADARDADLALHGLTVDPQPGRYRPRVVTHQSRGRRVVRAHSRHRHLPTTGRRLAAERI